VTTLIDKHLDDTEADEGVRRDTCNTVSPETLPDRLRAARFHDVDVEVRDGRQRWRSIEAKDVDSRCVD
jgi:hypothetical protein